MKNNEEKIIEKGWGGFVYLVALNKFEKGYISRETLELAAKYRNNLNEISQ